MFKMCFETINSAENKYLRKKNLIQGMSDVQRHGYLSCTQGSPALDGPWLLPPVRGLQVPSAAGAPGRSGPAAGGEHQPLGCREDLVHFSVLFLGTHLSQVAMRFCLWNT